MLYANIFKKIAYIYVMDETRRACSIRWLWVLWLGSFIWQLIKCFLNLNTYSQKASGSKFIQWSLEKLEFEILMVFMVECACNLTHHIWESQSGKKLRAKGVSRRSVIKPRMTHDENESDIWRSIKKTWILWLPMAYLNYFINVRINPTHWIWEPKHDAVWIALYTNCGIHFLLCREFSR